MEFTKDIEIPKNMQTAMNLEVKILINQIKSSVQASPIE